MQISIKTIRKLAFVAGMTLAAIAMFPAGAQADDSPQGRPSGPELRALMMRSRALNCLYGRAETCMTSAELRAVTLRSAAMTRLYGERRSRELDRRYDRAATRVSGVAAPSRVAASPSDGLDWAAVAIGAGGAFGVVLVGTTALMIVRRRQARYA